MPSLKDNLKKRLSHYRQIKISVIGRKSGKTISIPVWFVLEGEDPIPKHMRERKSGGGLSRNWC